MSITTFIQCYKRPKYLKEQVVAIRDQSVRSQHLWIVHNEGGKKIEYPQDVQVVYANPNLKFHLRFALALMADTEYVAIFDDDTIPGKCWYENCIETIKEQDCLCVTVGVKINLDWKSQYKVGWCNPNEKAEVVHFGGHAWFLKREHLQYMWQDAIINHSNGEDIMLSANLQIYGGITTVVPPHPISDRSLWGSGSNAMRYGSDEVAHWITAPTHFEDRFDLMRAYKNKGWKI